MKKKVLAGVIGGWRVAGLVAGGGSKEGGDTSDGGDSAYNGSS